MKNEDDVIPKIINVLKIEKKLSKKDCVSVNLCESQSGKI